MNPVESPTNAGFFRRAWARVCTDCPLKVIGVTLGMTAFFIAYFQLLNHPIFPVTVMPLTAIDRFITFRPEALVLYFSLWVYVPLVFQLSPDRRAMLSHGVGALVLSVTGLGLFLFWPTAVPNLRNDWGSHPWFSFLETVDASGNACPSMHVAFAVFAAIHLSRLLRTMQAGAITRAVNWLWCVGIVYSTLATGQHVFLDALAGALLGALVAVPRWHRRSASVAADTAT